METEATPSWLGGQRFDIFLPELNLAIEYHGKQHFMPIEFFGGELALKRTKKLDIRKYEKCLRNNVDIVYFSFEEDLSPDHVRERLKEYL